METKNKELIKIGIPQPHWIIALNLCALGFVFVYLKVQGIIDWNWLLVTLPFWWPLGYWIVIVGFFCIIWTACLALNVACYVLGGFIDFCEWLSKTLKTKEK